MTIFVHILEHINSKEGCADLQVGNQQNVKALLLIDVIEKALSHLPSLAPFLIP